MKASPEPDDDSVDDLRHRMAKRHMDGLWFVPIAGAKEDATGAGPRMSRAS